ncbi:MAG: hypothetical protein WB992_06695 [Bryobacteraceae bacterium]
MRRSLQRNARISFPGPFPYPGDLHMTTPAQNAANQRNAQLSTGPTSEAGKAKSSLNAVKTGLTGRTVLLPGDDAALYEAHIAEFMKRLQPLTDEERNLAQSLADTEWRLLRIPALEFGIYALGRLEFAELFPNEDPTVRNQLIEAKVLLVYQRPLSNLSLQETRLRHQREKDAHVLSELQKLRKCETRKRLNEAARQYIAAVNDGPRTTSTTPPRLGSNFHSHKSKAVPPKSTPISSPNTRTRTKPPKS